MKPRSKPVRLVRPTPTAERPLVIHPKEVAKGFHDYKTAPEILLGCMIVSGSYDTATVCRADNRLNRKLEPSDEQRRAHSAFRRVWEHPSREESKRVLHWARRIYAMFNPRKTDAETRGFAWPHMVAYLDAPTDDDIRSMMIHAQTENEIEPTDEFLGRDAPPPEMVQERDAKKKRERER